MVQTVILFSLLLLGCLDTGHKVDRLLIKKFGESVTEEGPMSCQNFYDLTNGECVERCGFQTHVGTDEEKRQARKEVEENSDIGEEEKKEIFEHMESARGLCVPGTGVLRPNNQVFINSDFCICLAGKPDSLNNCSAFCANKKDTASTLYGSVNLGNDILTDPKLKNLKNWCEVELSPDYTSPSCVLRVSDDSGSENLEIVVPPGADSFSVNVSTLEYETDYIAQIVEVGSGSNVSSDSFHLYRKKFPEDTGFPVGPLKIMPVGQYTCVTKSGSTDEKHDYYHNASKLHFYFAASKRPQAVAPNNKFLRCHDENIYGKTDSPLYPRMEFIPRHFLVWDEADIRFFDQDKNESPDINKYIQDQLLERFNTQANINIFSLLRWPGHPEVETPANVGFIMQPWVDPTTSVSFCPTEKHYNGNSPIFKILKDLIGVDTEGLFASEREPISIIDEDGEIQSAPQDILLIREHLLKKIWFYFEDGHYFIPDNITATQKTIYFYWPPDTHNPYIRKSSQSIYSVKAPENLGRREQIGLNNSIRPPDKRFGCVPSLGR